MRVSPRRRILAAALSVLLAATLAPAVSPTVAVAASGPTVPLPNTPSVPVSGQPMASRPPDEAGTRSLHGDQPASGAAKEGSGTHTATPLAPSATWNVSAQTGDFTWTYPLRVPPAAGGLEPKLSLSYSSSAVDGRTSATNNQASWAGDGWALDPGFIDRSYAGCADDKEGSNPGQKTGDLCWRSDNATAAYSGGGGMLIRDAATGVWRPKSDDGSRVERLFGAANGARDGEYWKITTVDGTQYFFGSRPDARSTWTVPVFGDDTGEPCHGATFDTSSCTQAWRWSLDKVVDRHGNTMLLQYQTEGNNYGRNLKDAAVSYIRGGWLTQIDYGLHAAVPGQASGRMIFSTAERCVPGSVCTWDKKDNFPDVPLDDRCDTATCKDRYSPTFWTTKRLASITTQVLKNGAYADVDRWTLDQQFPDPGDGEKAALWLKSITHTGLVGGSLTTPPVSFEGVRLNNRVYQADGLSPIIRFRVTGIVSESGGVISVNHAPPDCLAPPTNPESNTKRCFPVTWTKKNFAERTDYFNKYVVASVIQSDRISSNPQQETHYEYLDGAAWHYDQSEFTPKDKKTWNDFRGFGRVRIRKGAAHDPAGPVTIAEQRFYRGMHGDRLNPSGGTRTINVTDSEGGSHVDHDWLQGFEMETTTYDSATVVSKSITDPVWQGPTATRGDYQAYIVGPGTSRSFAALDNGRGWRITRTDTSYDDKGLATRVNDLGDISIAADDICSRTSYLRNTTNWVLDLPARVEAVATHCGATPSFPADAISDTRTWYDGQGFGVPPTAGNPTKVERLDQRPASGPIYLTASTARHDVHGRAIETADALGRKTQTAYTPATGGPVTQIVTTNPKNHRTTTVLEPAWGAEAKQVDPNGRVTESSFDALGRTAQVWLPNRPRGSLSANHKFSYLIRNDAPTVVTTSKLGPTGRYLSTNLLYDGLLRARQTQSPAVGGGRLISDTRYDSQGRMHKVTQPYFNDAPVDTGLWVASDTEIPGLSVTEYDGAGRPVARIFRGGATEKWRTTTRYGGDRSHVDPPDGDTATTTITDAKGQTTEFRQYKSGSPSGDYDATVYTHTPTGKPAAVRDPAGNIWRFSHDLAGRQIRVEDPDKGPATMSYDAAGQLRTQTDARGVVLTHDYDELGRKVSTRAGSTRQAEWTYDAAIGGVGQPTTATRWAGSNAYTKRVHSYTALNLPLDTSVTIPESEGLLAGTYPSTTKYNPDGSPASTAYPALGSNLFAETVSHLYDDAGRPVRTYGGPSGSTVEYALNTEYTRYGETQRVHLGEGTKRVWLSSYYDDHTRDVTRTIVDAEVPRPMLADVNYARDQAGNITSIADQPIEQPADVQCFRYDQLRRLTEAWTPGNGCGVEPATGALAGPAPYWQSFGYDQVGNRVSETHHAAAGDTVRSFSYPVPGQPRPHSLSSVTTEGPGGSRTDSYGYDATGNTTSRPGQQLRWDTEGHLGGVTAAGGNTDFVYGADGERLIRRDPTATTVYLPGQELRLDRNSGALTGTRYYSHGGKTVAIRTPAGLSWLAGDHQGTAQIAIGAADLTVVRRRQLPFGSSRGTGSAFPGERGFVGGTIDASTGLVHLGAREYDAGTGRFVSVDPIMDLSDPQQMHGYAYANNNPTTFADPSGLKFCSDDACTEWESNGVCHCKPYTPATPAEVPDIPRRPKATKPTGVKNTKLKNVLNHIYPAETDLDWTGSGKTSDALRNELVTGRATKGIYHQVAAAQDLNALVSLLEEDDVERARGRESLTAAERKIVIDEAKELWGALGQKDERGMVTRDLNENAGRKDQFDKAIKNANSKAAFGHVTDAKYVRQPQAPNRSNQVRGATTRGFMRGMGALSVVPMAIEIVRGPPEGMSGEDQMKEAFCLFDVAGICDSMRGTPGGGVA